MTSVRVKFRPSIVSGNEGSVFYQIIHKRVIRQIPTAYKIRTSEWDQPTSSIIVPAGCSAARARYLHDAAENVRREVARIKEIVAKMSNNGDFCASDVVKTYVRQPIAYGFMSFAMTLVSELRKVGKIKMAKRYATTLNSFSRFNGGREVDWRDFNSTLMLGYETYMLRNGLCRNTTSYYMRNLRSIFNRAFESGYDLPVNPFKHVYIGVDKTIKRAVPLNIICKIKNVDLRGDVSLEFARNIFMFSFLTRGMSFVDIAFLKKNDLRHGVITYRRRKTGRQLNVKIEAQTRKIMDQLGMCNSSYLIPIITDDRGDAERLYLNAYRRVNHGLHKLGEMLGLRMPLTMYVARHAWASIAKTNHVPLSTISEAMGHDSESTTRIYLNSLDTSLIDQANSKIMKLMQDWQN